MQKKVKIKTVGKYNGHNIKANKSIDISFKFEYSEMTSYIKLIQLLNENITIIVKVGDEKPKEIGMFMLKELKIGSDGEGVGKFNSSLDYIEPDNLNGLAGELIKILLTSSIEVEEEEIDDDEDEDY